MLFWILLLGVVRLVGLVRSWIGSGLGLSWMRNGFERDYHYRLECIHFCLGSPLILYKKLTMGETSDISANSQT